MMTALWLSLLAFAAMAAFFILWPLLRKRSPAPVVEREDANVALYKEHLADLEMSRAQGDIDEVQYNQLKLELDRSLLVDSDDSENRRNSGEGERNRGAFAGGKPYLIALAVLVPAAAGVFYHYNGASGDWEIQQLEMAKLEAAREAFENQQRPDPGPTRALAEKLQSQLRSRPENLQNWFLLARTRMELGEYRDAAKAYQEILKRDDSSGRVMAELAQALYMASGNKITPEIQTLLTRTLLVEPENPTALGLAGINSYEAGKYRQAIDYWEQALKVLGPRAAGATSLKSGIESAKKALAETGEEPAAEELAAASPVDTLHQESKGAGESSASGKGSRVTVNISLGDQVPNAADQVVFVYARAWNGPKMPLAIQKLKAADLPRQVILDESMAMAPGMTLAAFPQIELVARLSQSGTPTAQPGDWQATQGPFKLAELSGEVALEINTQIQ